MMKKFLILLLVLSMNSLALAIPYFEVDPADAKDHYAPSDWITINMIDQDVLGFSIDAIVDNAGGTSDEPQTFHPDLNLNQAGELNVNGHLVDYLFANTTIGAVSGVLYSFEYHVPITPASHFISIESFANGDDYWEPWFDYDDGSYYEGPIGPVAIHIEIPEPATIALLAFGALMLKRRK